MLAMTGEEKVGALLLALPKETSDAVLALLGAERSVRVRAEMARLQKLPQVEQTIDQALREVDALLNRASAPGKQAFTPSTTLSPEQNKKAPPAAPPPAPVEEPNERHPLAPLERLAADNLALALQDEHPRTVALVLHNLPGQKAGEVMKALPRALRAEVTVHLGKSPVAGAKVLQQVAQVVLAKERKLQSQAKPGEENRTKKTAGMLRMLDKPERAE